MRALQTSPTSSPSRSDIDTPLEHSSKKAIEALAFITAFGAASLIAEGKAKADDDLDSLDSAEVKQVCFAMELDSSVFLMEGLDHPTEGVQPIFAMARAGNIVYKRCSSSGITDCIDFTGCDSSSTLETVLGVSDVHNFVFDKVNKKLYVFRNSMPFTVYDIDYNGSGVLEASNEQVHWSPYVMSGYSKLHYETDGVTPVLIFDNLGSINYMNPLDTTLNPVDTGLDPTCGVYSKRPHTSTYMSAVYSNPGGIDHCEMVYGASYLSMPNALLSNFAKEIKAGPAEFIFETDHVLVFQARDNSGLGIPHFIVISKCGDGVHGGSEKCDDGPGGDCADNCQSCTNGTLNTTTHQCDLPTQFCGDGNPEGLEACDDGPGGDCADNCQSCTNGTLNTTTHQCDLPTQFCGDGNPGGLEACDDGPGGYCEDDCSRCNTGTPDPATLVCETECGDGTCEGSETQQNCSADCGEPPVDQDPDTSDIAEDTYTPPEDVTIDIPHDETTLDTLDQTPWETETTQDQTPDEITISPTCLEEVGKVLNAVEGNCYIDDCTLSPKVAVEVRGDGPLCVLEALKLGHTDTLRVNMLDVSPENKGIATRFELDQLVREDGVLKAKDVVTVSPSYVNVNLDEEGQQATVTISFEEDGFPGWVETAGQDTNFSVEGYFDDMGEAWVSVQANEGDAQSTVVYEGDRFHLDTTFEGDPKNVINVTQAVIQLGLIPEPPARPDGIVDTSAPTDVNHADVIDAITDAIPGPENIEKTESDDGCGCATFRIPKNIPSEKLPFFIMLVLAIRGGLRFKKRD